eukprot:10538532-Lingulodinium_polyedra.AAC.1
MRSGQVRFNVFGASLGLPEPVPKPFQVCVKAASERDVRDAFAVKHQSHSIQRDVQTRLAHN